MPLFLRKVRQARWFQSGLAWVPVGDIPADPLGDIATSDNRLSVYEIQDDKSNLEQVLAAMAANNQSLSNFDYVLFNVSMLDRLGIEQDEKKRGITADSEVNHWHRDLVKLSALKLVELARGMLQEGELERCPEKQITRLIAQNIALGRIDKTKVKLNATGVEEVNRIIAAEFAQPAARFVEGRLAKLSRFVRRLFSK